MNPDWSVHPQLAQRPEGKLIMCQTTSTISGGDSSRFDHVADSSREIHEVSLRYASFWQSLAVSLHQDRPGIDANPAIETNTSLVKTHYTFS